MHTLDLPLLRRRRVRRLRRRALRPDLAAPGQRQSRRLARRARGNGAAAASSSRASSRAPRPRRSCARPTSASRPSSGGRPRDPDWLVQLVDLGVPFGFGEQAPFLARGISAVRLSTAPDDAGRDAAADVTAQLAPARFARMGRAADADPLLPRRRHRARRRNRRARLPRRPDRPRLGDRARPPRRARPVSRRLDRPLRALPAPRRAARGRPGGRSAIRLGVWLWIGLLVGLGALAGVFPRGSAIPPPPDSPAVTDWPVAGLLASRRSRALGWGARAPALKPAAPADARGGARRVCRGPARPRRRRRRDRAREPLRPRCSCCPSLYAWLWLPQLRDSGWARDVLYGLGLVGPALALVAIAGQLGLGLDAPLYVVSLMTLGFIPWTTVLVLIAWAAVATQLGALAAGRYAPVAERPSPLERYGPSSRARKRIRVPAASGSVAARDVHERVGDRRLHDHVRLLAEDRVEDARRPRPTRPVARTKSSRSGRGRTSRASVPGRNAGAGSGRPAARAAPGARRGGRRRARRPGCRGGRRRASRPRTPNASGFPGRIATPQKTSSTPSRRAHAGRGRAGRPRRRPR